MLKLYDYFRSSACARVRIALHLKGLDFAVIPINLIKDGGEQLSTRYQQINPQSLVPTLQDGHFTLTQSIAIIEYLEDKYPALPIMPTDPETKALAKSFALTITSEIHPLNNLRVLKYLTETLQVGDEQKNHWYEHWIAKGFTALETRLATSATTGDFCFGDKPTIADICLAPQLYNARRYHCDLTPYPTLTRIDAHCQQHPAFIKARPVELVTEK